MFWQAQFVMMVWFKAKVNFWHCHSYLKNITHFKSVQKCPKMIIKLILLRLVSLNPWYTQNSTVACNVCYYVFGEKDSFCNNGKTTRALQTILRLHREMALRNVCTTQLRNLGVNFINILREAFTQADPKSAKRNLTELLRFILLWIHYGLHAFQTILCS